RLPYCDFHHQFELGPNCTFPEYSAMRELARTLAARAIFESESGNSEQAMRTIAIGARIAKHAEQEPVLISILVGALIRSMMHRAFVRALLSGQDDPTLMRRAAETCREFEPLPHVEDGLKSEVVFSRITIDMIRTQPADML